MSGRRDPLGTRATLGGGTNLVYFSLARAARSTGAAIDRLPYSVRVLLENVLRACDGRVVRDEDVLALARWDPSAAKEVPFTPSRVLLQDFTGVPCVADLAAMRSALHALSGDPARVNPRVPVDLVIDHSVQVDRFATVDAFSYNVEREYERNHERYLFLRWSQQAFHNFRVVPPGTGIVHQVNLEYLASVVDAREIDGERAAFPDTLVGTDSHTTMVNGLGVLGWGVGGIEAEAAMLGQPMFIPVPEVIGVKLVGSLAEGVTATDLVLTVTQMLRARKVVDKFVEFFGAGLSTLGLADRATIANMSPEYGATCGFFPIDAETLRYLRATGRDPRHVDLVERYAKEQGIFRTDDSADPAYTEVLTLDLSTVEPSLAGPRRPQDRVPLSGVKQTFRSALSGTIPGSTPEQVAVRTVEVRTNGHVAPLSDGAVAIAAITSCTNTSNPSVMVAAGLVAKKAVERGLSVPPWVKTSLAPGSRVVIEYLEKAGLMPSLETLGFNLVGFGCTTCIGNSGPLPEPISEAVKGNNLVVAAVLSGNRNFEGRVNPQTRLNYLASPPLVVAYALAGTVDIDLLSEPVGADRDGNPVSLKEIWPSQAEIRAACEESVTPDLFENSYAKVFEGDERWRNLPTPAGDLYAWAAESTYIQEPPFLHGVSRELSPIEDIRDARILAMVGDSVTTDHISPAGSIPVEGPAGKYLVERGVQPREFNSFGARRGNHEVMVRGTFGNIRLRNKLTPDVEGNWTIHFPTGERLSIYDAATRYQAEGTPTIVIAGNDYGMGSSRDWAAKGVNLLGVRAVIAESYERIHRSNLVGMGVLPLQFRPGENPTTLGLVGDEIITIAGLADRLEPRAEIAVVARRPNGQGEVHFTVISRLDGFVDVDYFRHGGILPVMLRRLMEEA